MITVYHDYCLWVSGVPYIFLVHPCLLYGYVFYHNNFFSKCKKKKHYSSFLLTKLLNFLLKLSTHVIRRGSWLFIWAKKRLVRSQTHTPHRTCS